MAVLVLTAAFSSGSWAQSPSPASSPSKKSPSAPPPSKKTPPTEPPSPEPAPPPEDPCLAAVYDDLIDCLQYASPDSNETKPTAECCSGVKKYLNDKPQCVCFLLKAPKDLADIVNQTRALKLPSLCKVKIPPIRQCFGEAPFFPAFFLLCPSLFSAAPYGSVKTFLRRCIAVLFHFQQAVLPPRVHEGPHRPPRRPMPSPPRRPIIPPLCRAAMPTRASYPPPRLFSRASPSSSSPPSSELGSRTRTPARKRKQTGPLPTAEPCNSSPSSRERISLRVLDRGAPVHHSSSTSNLRFLCCYMKRPSLLWMIASNTKRGFRF